MNEDVVDQGPLRIAIAASVAGVSSRHIQQGVARLSTTYRSARVPERPILESRTDVSAYATYRMPATAAAVQAAFQQLTACKPGWKPARLLDLGAGTGGATWAATTVLRSLHSLVLLEQSAEAIRLGRSIFTNLADPRLQRADWRRWQLPIGGRDPLPGADVVVAGYVLGELSDGQATDLVRFATKAAEVVLLVEPGTPAGYGRIIAARDQLLESGYQIAAPCPHDLACELFGHDWCHFAARVGRSAAHRRAKGGDLSYEDEKFSFVAGIRTTPDARPSARIIRRPMQRKGLVSLDLCEADGVARSRMVRRKDTESFRRARKATWGDEWDVDEVPGRPSDGSADLRDANTVLKRREDRLAQSPLGYVHGDQG